MVWLGGRGAVGGAKGARLAELAGAPTICARGALEGGVRGAQSEAGWHPGSFATPAECVVSLQAWA